MPRRPLIDALNTYVSGARARWHTPGHKGMAFPQDMRWDWDVTEVGELTPKTHRQDPLHLSEALMAETYGALRTWYSVQGATLPVMAAILAVTARGDRVVVDRNAHRSVHGALQLGSLQPYWVYPENGVGGYSLPVGDNLRAQIIREQQPAAVIVTNPTYEGLSEPLRETAAACHAYNIPLIVDEAHGTHFYGKAEFPPSALLQGADLVAHGAHKTEATLTQTGLLHCAGLLVSEQQVAEAWDLLATSSPSYLLMASLDELQAMRHTGEYRRQWELFARDMRSLWREMEARGLLTLQQWWESAGGMADPAKLTIVGPGDLILSVLRDFGEPEKSDPFGVTLVLTPHDDLQTLRAALGDLPPALSLTGARWRQIAEWPRAQQVMSPEQARRAPREWVPWRLSVGRVAAAPVIPYPPGVPLVVPGEKIGPAMLSWLESYQLWYRQRTGDMQGFEQPPAGMARKEGEQGIWVLCEKMGN